MSIPAICRLASSARHAFDQAVEKSGLENFRFHDLRHTFAARLVQAGINLYAIKELLAHESVKTTERYAHHFQESLRPSVMALDQIPDMEELGAALHAGTCPQPAKMEVNSGKIQILDISDYFFLAVAVL